MITPCLNPSQALRYQFTYLGRMECWVNLGSWLYTEILKESADLSKK